MTIDALSLRVPGGVLSHATAAAPAASTPATAGAGESLMSSLGHAFSATLDSIRNGEAAAIQGLTGEMAPAKVADAVMGAQRTLQAALAIRDKAVSAYQEVARMTI